MAGAEEDETRVEERIVMTVFEIVCHDGKKFLCKEDEELRRFIGNYRRLEGERLKREFPDEQFLVSCVRVIEMDEDKYKKLPASTESAAYFGALQNGT